MPVRAQIGVGDTKMDIDVVDAPIVDFSPTDVQAVTIDPFESDKEATDGANCCRWSNKRRKPLGKFTVLDG